VSLLKSTEEDTQQESKRSFEEALKDINDPLIPVRAHGLIALRRLILTKGLLCFWYLI
jgi:metal-sulfur cluster biosynthetic enzyme